MADFNVTVTTSDVFRSTVISKEALVAREKKLVLANLVKRYDRDTKGGVKTITIGTVSNLTAVQKSADTALEFSAPTETSLDIDLDQYWAVPMRIEEIAEIQSVIELAGAYAQKAGYAIAAKIDSFISADMVSNFDHEEGTYGSALSYATIRAAKLDLVESLTNSDEIVFAVTPKGEDDLLGIDEFTQYQMTGAGGGSNPMLNGRVGHILGMDVYMSPNLPQVAATPVQNNCLMFAKEAYALAVQKDVSVRKQYVLEHLADGIVTFAIWGGTVLRAEFGCVVKC